VNRLAGREAAAAGVVDAREPEAARRAFEGSAVVLSAVPYDLNVALARAAIRAGASFGDLGGNTDVVRETLALDPEAKRAGVSVVPDLGLAPGMGNTLAVYAMSLLDEPEEVHVRCGGLPRNPRPPLGYRLLFAVEGLTNEYFGKAVVLRDGKRMEIDTFDELETLEFPPPIGKVEAFTTSGGTSTCPWTFEGKIRDWDYKTIRYPGHFEKMKLLKDLGFLDLDPVPVGRAGETPVPVVPREVFHALARRKLSFPDDPDLAILRVRCSGVKDGKRAEVTLEVIDRFDPETGFTAMERTTGFPASIVCLMMARGEIARGAVPLELAVDGARFVAELRRRGIPFTERVVVG
jgi:lysine 6-dehydrogenase